MPRRSWSKNELIRAVNSSRSIRQVLNKLKLKEAGGNYAQIKKYMNEYNLDTLHFKGRAWNKGLKGLGKYRIPLSNILVQKSSYQSYKLRNRLFKEGIKKIECELCGWCKKSVDGRIPLELNHINGIKTDNRLENLRILCPNCHSLQLTHRGENSNIKAGWRNRHTRNT